MIRQIPFRVICIFLLVGSPLACGGPTEPANGESGSEPERIAASVDIEPSSFNMLYATDESVTGLVSDQFGDEITSAVVAWSSDDSSVATVDSTGLVRAVGVGQTTIRASYLTLSDEATVVVDPLVFTSIDAGWSHSCGLLRSLAAYCWGEGQRGALGNGGDADHAAPRPVAAEGIQFASVDAGSGHSCALQTDGSASCWGSNLYGQLGDGTKEDRWLPERVSGSQEFVSVSARGRDHSCGLTTDGSLYCWGWNYYGQIGDGTTTDRLSPTPIAGGISFDRLSVGGLHTCGLTPDGTAYCWGRNQAGQLGDSTTTTRHVPTSVAGGLAFQSISAGTAGTCAITTSSTTYCWGYSFGSFPQVVPGGLEFKSISAGFFHACGVTVNGEAYCWGGNSAGQIGDGTTGGSVGGEKDPRPVAGELSFTTISAGQFHTCGVTADERGYCWGDNSSGQLGDGTTAGRLTPVVVEGQGS